MQRAIEISSRYICLATRWVVLSLAVLAGYLYLEHRHEQEMAAAIDQAVIHEMDGFPVVYVVAEALVGELGLSYQDEWPDLFSSIVNRVEDPRWPNSFEGVIKQMRPGGKGCQIDAMCDQQMELMVSEVGDKAVQFAYDALERYYGGEWQSTVGLAHSWATPKAAEDHAYFDGLVLEAERDGHNYYSGDWVDVTKATFVKESPRPRARPTDLVAAKVAEDVATQLAQNF